jgi:ribose transport system substrate-binding protein
MSEEEKLIAAGMRLRDPVGRRVFMQLAAAAGVAVPVGAATGFMPSARAAAPGKIAAQFATLAND